MRSLCMIFLMDWWSILQPHQNSLILHAFMDLFCSFVRVNLFSEKASPLHAVLVLCFSFFAKALWLRNFDWFLLTMYIYMLRVSNFSNTIAWLLFRCQGKWCCKCITFCMPCQEMIEIVIFIIGREYFIHRIILFPSYSRFVIWTRRICVSFNCEFAYNFLILVWNTDYCSHKCVLHANSDSIYLAAYISIRKGVSNQYLQKVRKYLLY